MTTPGGPGSAARATPAGEGDGPQPLAGTRSAIARGGAWNTVAWIVTNACGALNTILLVRSMAHSEYGVFVMAASTMGIVGPLAGFGLSPALVQLAPRVAGGELAGSQVLLRATLRIGSVIGATVAVLTGVACLALGTGRFAALAVTLAIMIPVAAVSPLLASMSGFLQAGQQPKRLAKALLTPPLVLSAAVVVLCATTHPRATWIAAARTAATLVLGCLLFAAVLRSGGLGSPYEPATEAHRVRPRQLVSLGASLLSATLTAILLAQLDVLILGFSRGQRAVAFYGPASQMADNALTMAATVGTFYLPTIARVLARGDFVQAGEIYRWASRWTFVWVAPVVAVMMSCPGPLLGLLFGSDYHVMETPLRILAGGVLVNVLFGFNGITLDSLNRLPVIVGRQAVALVYNVGACALLIPRLGATGAALATSSTILLMNLVGSGLLHRFTRISPYNPKLLAVTSGLVVGVALGLGLGGTTLPGVVQLALVGSACIALSASVSYLVSSGPERVAIRNGLRRRRKWLALHDL